jgi:hypothetical protein
VHVERIGPPLGGGQAGIVDAVEEVLERTGHVAYVRRGAEQVSVGREHVGGTRRQRWPDHDLDPVHGIGGRTGQHRLEHGLHRW